MRHNKKTTHATYLSRLVSAKPSFKRAARVYLFPLPWRPKEIFAAIAMQQALFVGGGLALYPTAGQHLRSLGYTPEQSRRLAPLLPTFVKPLLREWRNIDNLHEMTVFPTVYGVLTGLGRTIVDFDSNHNAFAMGNCSVAVPKGELLKRTIFNDPEYPLASESPISVEQREKYIFLHELGHCRRIDSLNNTTLFDWARTAGLRDKKNGELAADLFAIHSEGSEAASFFKYLRGSTYELFLSYEFMISHDIALNLDRSLQNLPLLENEDVIKARIEVANAFKTFLKKLKNLPFSGDDSSLFAKKAILTATMMDETNLPPHARRRAELFVESFAYFRPIEFENVVQMMPKRIVTAIRENVARTVNDPFAEQTPAPERTTAAPSPKP